MSLEAQFCQRRGVSQRSQNERASGRNSLNNAESLGFVDANVLADAILAQNRMLEILSHTANLEEAFSRRDEYFHSYPPAIHAYDLFMLLRRLFSPSNFAVTSNFALLEASSVIVDKYIERKSQGRKKVRISSADRNEIGMGCMRFQIWHRNHGLVICDESDSSISMQLAIEYGCKAGDAHLIATAMKNSCKRFVTRDNHLKKQLKAFRGIKLVHPLAVLNELRAYAKAYAPNELPNPL
jgi:predicted nucleic acid-binding protein